MNQVAAAFTVRAATFEDASAIAAIYNQGIEDRVATFETQPRSAEDIETALRQRAGRYPTVVAEVSVQHSEMEPRTAPTLAAVAWASEYSPRQCYAGIAEFSVYTGRSHRGQGMGRTVMDRLISDCEAIGFWKLVARIFPENTASLALCESLGFRQVGVHRRHARLDGQWRDCVIIKLLLKDEVYSAAGTPTR